MALPSTSATSPANGTVAVNTILNTLLAAGGVITEWSDGTTQVTGTSLTTNPYGGTGSGAGNMGNTSAHFAIRDAGSTTHWLFGRGASDTSWTVSRAPYSTPFSGGSGSTFPTAAAATALFSAASLWSSTPGRLFVSADSDSAYGWTAFAITLGGGNVLSILADEPLASGTYDATDTDPRLWMGYYNSTGLAGGLAPSLTSAAIVYKRFVAASSNQRVAFATLFHASGTIVAPAADTTNGQIGQTPGSKERPRRIGVFRPGAASTSTGDVGDTSRLRWCTVGGRENGKTMTDGAGNYWIYCAGVWVRWDSSTPSLS
jgi:hypothetical protein